VCLSPGGRRLLTANTDLVVVCVDCALTLLHRTGDRRARQGVRTWARTTPGPSSYLSDQGRLRHASSPTAQRSPPAAGRR